MLLAHWPPPQTEQVVRNLMHSAAAPQLRARVVHGDSQVKWALVIKDAPADLVELGEVGGLVEIVRHD